VTVSRKDVAGSPEGDATLTVTAKFPNAGACRAFIDFYAPRERLTRVGDEWSRDVPGRELRSLSCNGARMTYEAVLY